MGNSDDVAHDPSGRFRACEGAHAATSPLRGEEKPYAAFLP